MSELFIVMNCTQTNTQVFVITSALCGFLKCNRVYERANLATLMRRKNPNKETFSTVIASDLSLCLCKVKGKESGRQGYVCASERVSCAESATCVCAGVFSQVCVCVCVRGGSRGCSSSFLLLSVASKKINSSCCRASLSSSCPFSFALL